MSDDITRDVAADLDLYDALGAMRDEFIAGGGTDEQWLAYVDEFVESVAAGGEPT